jgi:hypothetical protein
MTIHDWQMTIHDWQMTIHDWQMTIYDWQMTIHDWNMPIYINTCFFDYQTQGFTGEPGSPKHYQGRPQGIAPTRLQ